jgi:hypothetical protein
MPGVAMRRLHRDGRAGLAVRRRRDPDGPLGEEPLLGGVERHDTPGEALDRARDALERRSGARVDAPRPGGRRTVGGGHGAAERSTRTPRRSKAPVSRMTAQDLPDGALRR